MLLFGDGERNCIYYIANNLNLGSIYYEITWFRKR